MKSKSPYNPFLLFLSSRPTRNIGCILIAFFLIFSKPAFSQVSNSFNYEEISINMHVPKIGNADISSIIQGQSLFLSIKEVFNFLEIKNNSSPYLDSISGFFIHPQSLYIVDNINNNIIYEGIVFNLLQNDLIKTESDLYLRSDYFNEVFSLQLDFNFRALSVTLNTKVELPAIKKMQQELMRQNISLLKKELVADTTIQKSRGLLNGGFIDWGVFTNQEATGQKQARYNADIGAFIGGGEVNLNLVYNSDLPLDMHQQNFRWRLVNNNSKLVRQVSVGRIATMATASIFAPVTGVQITNAPTTYRKSFGSYRLTNTTEPNWTVELYVNNVLINYTKADAAGFFSFDVPLVYGRSTVTMRAYGPYGEERVKEEAINIPFNFLPENNFEYTISAGVVSDQNNSKFSRANFNYGFSKRITIGAGVEYLSTVLPGKVMPFINASWRVGSRLIVSAEHSNGVRSTAFLSYRLPSNLQLELNYTKYAKNQTAIIFNFSEERKAALSYYLRTKKVSAFSRLSVSQIVLPKTKITNAEFLISGVVAGISSNLTTTAIINNNDKPNLFTDLSFNFRLPAAIRFTPQIRYDHSGKQINSIRAEIERRVLKNGYANISYQKNRNEIGDMISLGIRYNFSFAQTGAMVRQLRNGVSTSQYARGSILFNDKENTLQVNNFINVGRAAIIVAPFIDLNWNGKRDHGEPKAEGLKLNMRGGRIVENEKDTTISILGLEAYNDYIIEINKSSFENISWQVKKPNIKVTTEPNHYRKVEVPVIVVGEVSGNVIVLSRGEKKGLGRILINIYKNDTSFVGKTLSEPDGYFSYLGLAPGSYSAAVDIAQMQTLNMGFSPAQSFKIKLDLQGDIVDGVLFNLVAFNDTAIIQKEIIVEAPALKVDQAPIKDTITPKIIKKRPVYLNEYFIPIKNKKINKTILAKSEILKKNNFSAIAGKNKLIKLNSNNAGDSALKSKERNLNVVTSKKESGGIHPKQIIPATNFNSINSTKGAIRLLASNAVKRISNIKKLRKLQSQNKSIELKSFLIIRNQNAIDANRINMKKQRVMKSAVSAFKIMSSAKKQTF